MKRTRRQAPLRTDDFIKHELLGLALGRWAMADPKFRDALTKGYTLAIRERDAGRMPDGAAAQAALEVLRGELARLHAVPKRRAS